MELVTSAPPPAVLVVPVLPAGVPAVADAALLGCEKAMPATAPPTSAATAR
jgi:hypothetical protein